MKEIKHDENDSQISAKTVLRMFTYDPELLFQASHVLHHLRIYSFGPRKSSNEPWPLFALASQKKRDHLRSPFFLPSTNRLGFHSKVREMKQLQFMS